VHVISEQGDAETSGEHEQPTKATPKIGPRAFLVALAAAWSLASPGWAAAACGTPPYSYAGFVTMQAVGGVGATIAALSVPEVKDGHVAGWLGVGGIGVGPRGTDEWIQIGLSAFPGDRTNHVYVEVARPGSQPRYTLVRANLPAGERHRFAVRELEQHPGWWRALLDARPVSRPVRLPGSHRRLTAQVTAESWNAGTGACNLLAYSFSRVSIAGAAARWHPLTRASIIQDAGYRLAKHADSSFVARSYGRPAPLAMRSAAVAGRASARMRNLTPARTASNARPNSAARTARAA
jgi:hypothetical protein